MRGSSRSTRSLLRGISLAAAGALTVALLPSGVAAAQPRGSAAVCPAPDGNYELFIDIGGTHEANIECMAGYEIAQGTTPVTYNPSGDVRRDSMATFVVNLVETATGEELAAPADDQFGDIAGSDHRANINKLANAGLVSGTAANTYSPANLVPRDQMASFIANAIDYVDDGAVNASIPPANTDNPFSDVRSGNTHHANILRLAGVDVVGGTTPTTYSPVQDVTRAQMATFIMQGADYLDSEGFWLPTAPTTPAEPVAATTGEYLNRTIEACTFDSSDDTVEIIARSGDDLHSFALDLADDTFTVDGDELDLALRADERTLEAACAAGTIADIDYDTDGVSTVELFTADADRATNLTTGDNTSTLTEAVAAANAGDVIEARGDFAETVNVDVDDLTIEAAGDGAALEGSIVVDADAFTLEGFTLSDYDTAVNDRAGLYFTRWHRPRRDGQHLRHRSGPRHRHHPRAADRDLGTERLERRGARDRQHLRRPQHRHLLQLDGRLRGRGQRLQRQLRRAGCRLGHRDHRGQHVLEQLPGHRPGPGRHRRDGQRLRR